MRKKPDLCHANKCLQEALLSCDCCGKRFCVDHLIGGDQKFLFFCDECLELEGDEEE